MKRIMLFIAFVLLYSISLFGQSLSTSLVVDMQSEDDLVLALDLYSQKKYPEAISILKKYTEKNPQDKDAQILLGKSFVYSKDCTEAINVFKRIESIMEKKDKDNIYVDISQCYIQDKRYKEAKDYLNSVKESAADKDGIKYLLAIININTQNIKEAKPLFLDLYLTSSAFKTRAAYYLAVISQEEKNLNDSIKYLEVASSDKGSDEGREAAKILTNIAGEKEKFTKKSHIKPFFKLKSTYLIDSNVPEMAENEDENIKYLTDLGSVSMRWGARTDLELSGGINYKNKKHMATATLVYFSDFHFLPINSMIPRSEFDANYYDLMFIYAGLRYSYDFIFNKNRLSPGLEIGVLNLFTDQFGSFVHQEGSKTGPNFYLTSLSLAPNLLFLLGNTMTIKPYYRLRMDFNHQSEEDPSQNSLSGLGHSFGLEGIFNISGDDSALLRFEYDKNDSDGSQWKYSGLRFGFGLSILALSVIDLRLLIDYFIRDFSDSQYVLDDGSIESRSDKRLSVSVGPEFILGSLAKIGLKYSFIRNQSNITKMYDYQRHLGMLFWELKF